jgi:hypothetical protein
VIVFGVRAFGRSLPPVNWTVIEPPGTTVPPAAKSPPTTPLNHGEAAPSATVSGRSLDEPPSFTPPM